MNILKAAQESGENNVVVGSTGPGKITDVEALMAIVNRGGHPGGQVSIVGANVAEGMARMAAINVEDCAEIAIPAKP